MVSTEDTKFNDLKIKKGGGRGVTRLINMRWWQEGAQLFQRGSVRVRGVSILFFFLFFLVSQPGR